jgi:hypothetical protein
MLRLVALIALVAVGCEASSEVSVAPVAVADAVVTVRSEVPDLPNAFEKKTQATPILPKTITVNGKAIEVEPLLTGRHPHNSWLIKSDDEKQDVIDWIMRRFVVDEKELACFNFDELRQINNGLSATLRLVVSTGEVHSTIDEAELPVVEMYQRGTLCRNCKVIEGRVLAMKPPFKMRTVVVGPSFPLPADAMQPVFLIPTKSGQKWWIYQRPGDRGDLAEYLMKQFKERN